MVEWENAPINIDKYVGFCYVITEKDTGKKYIGIKKFWMIIKSPPLKGKKRRRLITKETDWRTYNTSNPTLQEKLKSNPDNYTKEIILCCDSVTKLKAYEAFYQLHEYLYGDWDTLYNEVINLRLRIRKGDKK